MVTRPLKVLELFAGIGACSKALTNLGIEHEIVDAVEIDKFAIRSFNAIHGTNFSPQDVTEWDKDIKCDLIMHGSPCQDFSIAGKGAGGDEGSGTRSSLLYETLRIVEKLKPKYVIWENVPALLSEKHHHNFSNYLMRMRDMGYLSLYKKLNAKDFGVPQNRVRVFTVSVYLPEHAKHIGGDDLPHLGIFDFPKSRPLTKRLADVLESEVDERYYLSEKMVNSLIKHNEKHTQKGTGFIWKPRDTEGVASTLRANGALCPTDNTITIRTANSKGYDEASIGDSVNLAYPESKTRRGRVGHSVVQTLTTSDNMGVVEPQFRIRKLTPKECWRLMGFDDQSFDRVKDVGISNSQLYKQAGNSIVVNVLMAILTNLLKGSGIALAPELHNRLQAIMRSPKEKHP